MAKEFSRTHRVAEQIQKEVAVLIQREVKDPRLGMITVNSVSVSKDLSYADIYFTTLVGVEDKANHAKEAEDVLNHAAGFLRGMIGKAIKLRITPQLRFHYDVSVARGQYMTDLIRKAVKQDDSSDEERKL